MLQGQGQGSAKEKGSAGNPVFYCYVPANAVAVGACGDGRELAEQTKDLLVADALRLVQVVALDGRVGLGVKGRHGSDRAHDHAHRVRIVAERLEVLRQIFVNERVPEHAHLPVAELGLQ